MLQRRGRKPMTGTAVPVSDGTFAFTDSIESTASGNDLLKA